MPEYPYIPKRDTKVWIANRDGTTDKRWVDAYSPENDMIYLRSVESNKKWNCGLREYPASLLGVTIFYDYREAKAAAKRFSDNAALELAARREAMA